MRVEAYAVDSMLHITKRGARGMPIVRDAADTDRFARLLFYLNDEYRNENWEREVAGDVPYSRPQQWPERKPLVGVLAWVLMPNHFHLLLKEVQDGGISLFMRRLCGSMTMHFNAKYDEQGSIFQGSYRGRTVSDDDYARYVAAYVMVKNVYETYPGGLRRAVREFDTAWKWAIRQKHSSLPDYATDVSSPIIDTTLKDMCTCGEFKALARDMVEAYYEKHSEFSVYDV